MAKCKKNNQDRIMMILDSKDDNGNFLMSNISYCVAKKNAKKLIDKKRAFYYKPKKRVASKDKKYIVDGRFMTRSEMLKLKGKRIK